MAVEKESILEAYFDQLPRDPSSCDKALGFIADAQSEIFNLFTQHLISKSQALKELVSLSMKANKFINNLTAEITMNVAYAQGYDTLTNDMSGAQSADWFEETERPFSTGLISSGLGVVIINHDIGMAAVNSNIVTENDLRDTFLKVLDRPEIIDEIGLDFSPLSLVSAQSLQGTTAKAIDNAFNQFSSISPNGVPQDGTMIVLFGVDCAQKKEIDTILQVSVDRIKKHPMMNDGRFKGSNRKIIFNIDGLGHAGELIYGGKNHPQYGRVNIYTRR